jgi:hypothetical protein
MIFISISFNINNQLSITFFSVPFIPPLDSRVGGAKF